MTITYKIVEVEQYWESASAQLNTLGAAGWELGHIYNDQAIMISGSSVATSSYAATTPLFDKVITPTTLSGNTNNYNPTGLSTASVIRISASTNISLTGIQAPSPATNKTIFLINVGSGNVLLVRNNPASLAANQFKNNNDIMLNSNETVILWYDIVTQAWRAMGQHTV